MNLTSKQRAYLGSQASTMNPIFQIGKASLTPELITALNEALETMLAINEEGKKLLGDKFYCLNGDTLLNVANLDYVQSFVKEVRDSFRIEKAETEKLEAENLTDFIVCGGAMESHRLQKEVNFSDTFITENNLYRIPGSGRGRKWSAVNTHGWFSYELNVKPNAENKIKVLLGTMDESIDIKITLDDKEYTVSEKADGKY